MLNPDLINRINTEQIKAFTVQSPRHGLVCGDYVESTAREVFKTAIGKVVCTITNDTENPVDMVFSFTLKGEPIEQWDLEVKLRIMSIETEREVKRLEQEYFNQC